MSHKTHLQASVPGPGTILVSVEENKRSLRPMGLNHEKVDCGPDLPKLLYLRVHHSPLYCSDLKLLILACSAVIHSKFWHPIPARCPWDQPSFFFLSSGPLSPAYKDLLASRILTCCFLLSWPFLPAFLICISPCIPPSCYQSSFFLILLFLRVKDKWKSKQTI